jgi:hypothetical protein
MSLSTVHIRNGLQGAAALAIGVIAYAPASKADPVVIQVDQSLVGVTYEADFGGSTFQLFGSGVGATAGTGNITAKKTDSGQFSEDTTPNPPTLTTVAVGTSIDSGLSFGDVNTDGLYATTTEASIGLEAADGTFGFIDFTAGANAEVFAWGYETTPGVAIVSTDTPTSVPEPASLALLAVGAAGLAAVRRKRRG